MAVHDWLRVDAGTFHGFHVAWVTHLSEAFNGGLLPAGYYSMPEQHGNRLIADVLTLQVPAPFPGPPSPTGEGAVAVADAPPRVRRRLEPAPTARTLRRTVTIRHVSGHRIVALVEIISRANKDRDGHVAEFADKVESALSQGIHVLLVDLFPPGSHDSAGMHGAIWERCDDEPYIVPPGEPLALASYVAGAPPVAYLEHLKIGDELPEMPLFLTRDRYIRTPLEATYQAAYRGMPAFWREVLEGRRPAPA